eukprot:1432306-Alexandrium_andersonii.AAC.1
MPETSRSLREYVPNVASQPPIRDLARGGRPLLPIPFDRLCEVVLDLHEPRGVEGGKGAPAAESHVHPQACDADTIKEGEEDHSPRL